MKEVFWSWHYMDLFHIFTFLIFEVTDAYKLMPLNMDLIKAKYPYAMFLRIQFVVSWLQIKWWWFQLPFLWFCSVYRSLGQVKWDLLLALLYAFGFFLLRALGFTTLLNMTPLSWGHLILYTSTTSFKGTQLRLGIVLGVVSCVQQVRH